MLFSTPEKPASLPASASATATESAAAALLPPWWGRLETLWLGAAPLCALLYTLCLTLAPNDLWYHVRAGELIARGAIPTQNLMSSGVSLGAPFYYQSWLAELGLFWSLKLGGLSGLVILRALCVTGALGLVTLATFRQLLRLENPPSRLVAARLTALSAIIGFAMLSNNLDLRPQTFSALLFGLWIFAALEFRAPHANRLANRRAWGAILVISTLVWANTHGAFIISILGLSALAVGDFFSNRARFRASLGVALLASAAVLLNPRGAALYFYVASLSNNRIGQKWIQEWKSPAFDEWHSVLFWICLAACALFLLLRIQSKSPRPTDRPTESGATLFLAILAIMAARDQRSILWFALFFVPVFPWQLAVLTRSQSETRPQAVARAAQTMNAVLLFFLLALPSAFLPQFKANWPWPDEFKNRFAPTPASFGGAPALILERTTPVAATQFLLASPPRGRLWTDMVCGSYLTYAGRGQIRPLCDPRIELFPDAFWEDYLRLAAGPPDAAQILQERGFSDALLDRVSMPGLIQRLKTDPQWQIVAQNGSTVLFRQISKQKF